MSTNFTCNTTTSTIPTPLTWSGLLASASAAASAAAAASTPDTSLCSPPNTWPSPPTEPAIVASTTDKAATNAMLQCSGSEGTELGKCWKYMPLAINCTMADPLYACVVQQVPEIEYMSSKAVGDQAAAVWCVSETGVGEVLEMKMTGGGGGRVGVGAWVVLAVCVGAVVVGGV